MQPTTEDRRKHERYKLENSVSVSSHGVNQITDISMGGFCFRCPPFTPVSDFWETDIITSVATLEGFPAKRIWVSMVENGTHEYLPAEVGAKFGKLTKKQSTLLSEVIEAISHTEGPEH
jgi:hypothetical protein